MDPVKLNVKLNELAKQILMLLPLLLLLLLLLYVLYHVLIRGREAPPYNYVVNTYSRISSRSSRAASYKSALAVHSAKHPSNSDMLAQAWMMVKMMFSSDLPPSDA